MPLTGSTPSPTPTPRTWPAAQTVPPPHFHQSQILGVVATPFTLLTTHQNAPEAYPSLTSYAADH